MIQYISFPSLIAQSSTIFSSFLYLNVFSLPSLINCKYFFKILLQLVEMFTKIQCSVFFFGTLNRKSFLPSFGLFSIGLPVLLVSHFFTFLKSLKDTLYFAI